MRFNHYLDKAAKLSGSKEFIIFSGQSISYDELHKKARKFSQALIEVGVNVGDRVVIVLDNSIESVISLFAVWYAGAIVVILNPTTKQKKFEFILNNCQAKIVITQKKLQKELQPVINNSNNVIYSFIHGLEESLPNQDNLHDAISAINNPQDNELGISSDLAMIIYTSGSTGIPKGVMMTHDNVQAAAESVSKYLEITEQDIILNCLPLSFDYGLYQVLMTVMCQSSLVLEKSFTFPASILKLIPKYKITGFPIVPTMSAMILQMKQLKTEDFQSLKFISNTAAALSLDQIIRLQKTFPSAKLFSMYGMTESKRCTYLPPEELSTRPLSVGKAIPNTEVYIINENGERVGSNIIGELIVRGPHVMQGYWNEPEATKKHLKTGKYPWEYVLHTGDLFRSDEDGFLYFVGRKDDIIKCRGEKVSPLELELVISELKEIAEVAVIGVPDEIFGTAIKAIVVPIEGSQLTSNEVLKHISNRLENYMIPKYIEFVKSLPKTNNGKIDKNKL